LQHASGNPLTEFNGEFNGEHTTDCLGTFNKKNEKKDATNEFVKAAVIAWWIAET